MRDHESELARPAPGTSSPCLPRPPPRLIQRPSAPSLIRYCKTTKDHLVRHPVWTGAVYLCADVRIRASRCLLCGALSAERSIRMGSKRRANAARCSDRLAVYITLLAIGRSPPSKEHPYTSERTCRRPRAGASPCYPHVPIAAPVHYQSHFFAFLPDAP